MSRKPYLAFLDLEKAFNRLALAVLWESLRGKGGPGRLITVIKIMYKVSKANVRTPHGMTKKLDITLGYIKSRLGIRSSSCWHMTA